MRAHGAWGAAAVAATLLLVALPGSAAAATQSFTASPRSGGVGSTVTVRSVTVCTLPSGVTGAPLAEVSLTQGPRVLAKGRSTASASGAWHGVLVVGSTARPGPATVSAFCLASPQAEGALFEYRSLSFTVTGLPRTGAGSGLALAASLGVLLLAAGSLLVVASHRRAATAAAPGPPR